MIHFPAILILIILMFLSIALWPADQIAAQSHTFYRIEKPEKNLIDEIERQGGIVDRYFPGDFAEVYIPPSLKEKLISRGILLKPMLKIKKPFELSDDHRIGHSYHSYEAVSFILDSLAQLYPDLCRLHSIGQTAQGRGIWAMLISNQPQMEETEPEVKLIGAMHGDEYIGQEMMLCLIDSLLSGYDQSLRLQALIDSAEIWIVPHLNYDGAALDSRFNANNIDLNRNFPDREFDLISDPAGRQPETQALMNWSAAHNFVLSANFHSGAQAVNYPWDKNLDGDGYAATPDDATFVHLALTYSKNNPPMFASARFPNGIVNGAAWYEISGGMQDWNYHWPGCLEVTVELSEDKQPDPGLLPAFWQDNRRSLLSYLEQCKTGLRGTVTDSENNQPLAAKITVLEIGKEVYADPDLGDYYRLLPAGIYGVRYEAEGYLPLTISQVVVDSGRATTLNVQLTPQTYFIFSGMIQDAKTDLPIGNARLLFIQNGLAHDSTKSIAAGNFSFPLAPGRYLLEISKDGYQSLRDSLILTGNLEWNYELQPLQLARIYGRIVLDDHSSLLNTVVYCQNQTDTIESGDQFAFANVSAGLVNIFAYKSGYKTAHLDTLVHDGDSLRLELTLFAGYNEWFCDFEADGDQFKAGGEWQRGSVESGPEKAFSGVNVWATNLAGNYERGAHLARLETPIMSIQGLIMPRLEFYHWYEIEENYDGGNIKISIDEGKSWQIIYPEGGYSIEALPSAYGNPLSSQPAFTGKSGAWKKAELDLTSFKETPFLQLRFEFGADEQKEAAGWYIDNFKLFDGNAVDVARSSNPAVDAPLQLRIYPNPANPIATLRFKTLRAEKLHLQLFNSIGQQVVNRYFTTNADEWAQWNWTGMNDQQQSVASGIYIIYLSGKQGSLFKKIIFIR